MWPRPRPQNQAQRPHWPRGLNIRAYYIFILTTWLNICKKVLVRLYFIDNHDDKSNVVAVSYNRNNYGPRLTRKLIPSLTFMFPMLHVPNLTGPTAFHLGYQAQTLTMAETSSHNLARLPVFFFTQVLPMWYCGLYHAHSYDCYGSGFLKIIAKNMAF